MKEQSMLFTIIPFVFVVVVIMYEKMRQKKISNEYDEMQLRIRGKGAWYGFYVSVFYLAACYVMEKVFEIHILGACDAVFLGVMISGSVIVGYSILHDSYYGLNWSGSRNVIFLLMIAAAVVVSGLCLIAMIRDGEFQDLKTPCTDERMMPVMCIPLFLTILVTTLIRHMKPEEEDD